MGTTTSTSESSTLGRAPKDQSRSSASMASFPSTSPAWMLACTYTTGRPSRRASAGVRTTGREATTRGTTLPMGERASSLTLMGAPSARSESRKLMTSAYDDVSR